MEGIGSGCDEEALRLMDMMPNWKPATLYGEPITSQQTIKIPFNLKAPANSVYKVVGQMPAFPGGQAALLRFLVDNMEYPEQTGQGMVLVQFILEKDGSLSNLHGIKGMLAMIQKQFEW